MSEVIDNFFQKINGSYFGFIGILLSGLSMTIAILLYFVEDSSFFITSNFISDLSIGPNGADLFFAISLILMGLFFASFFLFVARYLQKLDGNSTFTWIGFGFFLIYSFSSIIITVFPLDSTNQSVYDTHIIIAVFLFAGASLGMIFFGIVEYQTGKIPNIFALNSFIVAIFAGLFAILLPLGNFTDLYTYDIVIYLIEWITFGFFIIWLILHAYCILKVKPID
ncbi:MAG: DUF998 domain-containing protein [Candidatus Hodarchaeales archaeon]|jgi:hypothetical protein